MDDLDPLVANFGTDWPFGRDLTSVSREASADVQPHRDPRGFGAVKAPTHDYMEKQAPWTRGEWGGTMTRPIDDVVEWLHDHDGDVAGDAGTFAVSSSSPSLMWLWLFLGGCKGCGGPKGVGTGGGGFGHPPSTDCAKLVAPISMCGEDVGCPQGQCRSNCRDRYPNEVQGDCNTIEWDCEGECEAATGGSGPIWTEPNDPTDDPRGPL
jgi:hypothetical protein